jgi:hypothetical protein
MLEGERFAVVGFVPEGSARGLVLAATRRLVGVAGFADVTANH